MVYHIPNSESHDRIQARVQLATRVAQQRLDAWEENRTFLKEHYAKWLRDYADALRSPPSEDKIGMPRDQYVGPHILCSRCSKSHHILRIPCSPPLFPVPAAPVDLTLARTATAGIPRRRSIVDRLRGEDYDNDQRTRVENHMEEQGGAMSIPGPACTLGSSGWQSAAQQDRR